MTDTTVRPAPPAAARMRLMLEGPIVPTLLRLAVPNLVVNVVLIAVTTSVDAHFVGRLGLDALAGLGDQFGGDFDADGLGFVFLSGGNQNAAVACPQVDDSLARFHLGQIEHDIHNSYRGSHIRGQLAGILRLCQDRDRECC